MADTIERPTKRCPHGCPEPFIHIHTNQYGESPQSFLPAERDWIFTFGYEHFHPDTGKNLAHCYVRVHGDIETSRERMLEKFGKGWSMQYPSLEAANTDLHRMTEVAF